jgi:imidazolonepropionase-like amidohydrolase
MRKIIATLLLLAVGTLVSINSAPRVPESSLVLTHVTVIDGTGAAPQETTVLIAGNRISGLGNNFKPPDGATVIDATGKFLIPGLWDMHIHWYDKDSLPLFTANGVTGVRIMFGFPMHQEWRREVANGTLAGPRMLIASPIVDGPKPVWPSSVAVATEAEGRQAVDKVKADGADFVKVYSLLPRDAYFAIAGESKKQGIPFAGHVPYSVSGVEASDAGQKSIEHLTGVLLACSTKEEELSRQLAEAAARAGAGTSIAAESRKQSKTLVDTYGEAKAKALFARFAKNGTWQCPTLTVLHAIANLDDEKFTNDPRLKYLPSSFRAAWNPKTDFRLRSMTAEDYANSKRVFQKYLEITGSMSRAGVRIIAGTDVLNPYCFPGFSLHDELEWLVKAGLSPMAALQAATRNAAEFAGMLDSLGTIEKGKIADMVLLDASPLQDIRNTTKINAVIQNGRLLNRAKLDEMLLRIEQAAKK